MIGSELFDCPFTVEAAQARVLFATEHHVCFIVDRDVIDVSHAGLNVASETHTARQITRVNSRRKTELGVVRELKSMCLVISLDDADNRAEDLLAEQFHLRGHISEHVR